MTTKKQQRNKKSCVMQIVIAVLAGWGIGISTALKVFGGEKKEEPAAAAQA